MVANGERIERLWSESKLNEAPRGPLFDARNELAGVFDTLNNLSGLPAEVEKQGDSLISPIVDFRAKETPYFPSDNKSSYQFNAKARKSDINDIFIAIQEKPTDKDEQVDSSIYEYILNSDGSVVRTDELTSHTGTINVSDEEIEFVKKAGRNLTSSLTKSVSVFNSMRYNEQQEIIYRKQRTTKRVIATIGTIAATAGIATAGYFAWSTWIDQPGKEDDARRAAYDADNNVIDGAGIELGDQKLVILPNEDFDEIPSFRGDDSLESPRTVTLDAKGCTVIDVDNLDGKTLRVAAPQYSPIGEYLVVAYAQNDKLNVCTTETPEADITGDELKIALQLTDPNER